MAHTSSPRWRTALVAVGLPLIVFWATPAPAQVIRFALEKDYAPFVSAGPTGRAQGLSIDVLELLQPHLGAQVQMLPPDNLANILQAARRGEVDLISSLRPTPERAEFLAFTEPYVKVPAVLVVKQAAAPPNLKDLSNHPVAVGKGYAVEGFVRANYPPRALGAGAGRLDRTARPDGGRVRWRSGRCGQRERCHPPAGHPGRAGGGGLAV